MFQLKLAIVTSILYLLIPRTVYDAFKYPGVEPKTNISRGSKNNLSQTPKTENWMIIRKDFVCLKGVY